MPRFLLTIEGLDKQKCSETGCWYTQLSKKLAANNHLYIQFQKIQHHFLASKGTTTMWYIYAGKTTIYIKTKTKQNKRNLSKNQLFT